MNAFIFKGPWHIGQTKKFTPLGFLAELQQHVFDTFEQNTRWFGAYSCRSRGVASESVSDEVSLSLSLPEPAPRSSASWARCMKKIFELDPLLCPKCGSSMRIKAFITDPKEVDTITKGLGLPLQRAPPKLRSSHPLAA